MFLQAGRAAVRDLLEAQDALLSAQNALISAVVSYRTAEWDMQRDTGKLEVTVDGLWQEYRPERIP
jgi:outer membrane protein TolC